MPDYQKLYTTLFNRVSDIIEELQKAQQETEEIYIYRKKKLKPAGLSIDRPAG